MQEPEYFPNRQCNIIFNGKQIGNFGIIHPEVLYRLLHSAKLYAILGFYVRNSWISIWFVGSCYQILHA